MKNLILVPTILELQQLKNYDPLLSLNHPMEVCGFGVIGAAVGASHFIEIHQPDRVVLGGIAGSFSSNLQIGAAYCFDAVRCEGIGIRRDGKLIAPAELDFTEQPLLESPASGSSQSSQFALHCVSVIQNAKTLLTCCESSADVEIASSRSTANNAVAEDMEGYSVAMACEVNRIPLMIVRGISNLAGDHDKQNWKIEAALENAACAIVSAVESSDWESGV